MRLRDFLRLGTAGGQQVITGNRRPLGYEALACNNSTAVGLTITAPNPAGGGYTYNFVIVQNNDASIAVRWRDDGTDPTTTVGMRLKAGAELDYAGDLAKLRFIAESGSPSLDVAKYA